MTPASNSPDADLPIHLLLVDDQPRNLEVLEAILQAPEYRLVRATSGDEALLALMRDEFAAIVLDIQMPDMSGLELARLIKQRKRNQHIPILFLTAHYLEDTDVLDGYGAGAVDYLTKPIHPQILRSKVAVFVELFRTTRALARVNSALEIEIVHRRAAQEALHRANDQLEARVQQRTEELSRSEEQFRRAVEDAPIPVIMHAEDGRVLQVSKTWAGLTGYTMEEAPTLDAWLTRAYGFGANEVRNAVRRLFDRDTGMGEVEFVRSEYGRSAPPLPECSGTAGGLWWARQWTLPSASMPRTCCVTARNATAIWFTRFLRPSTPATLEGACCFIMKPPWPCGGRSRSSERICGAARGVATGRMGDRCRSSSVRCRSPSRRTAPTTERRLWWNGLTAAGAS